MRNIRKCNIDCKELDWKHKTAPCNGILWRPRRAIRVFTRSKGGRKRGWGQVVGRCWWGGEDVQHAQAGRWLAGAREGGCCCPSNLTVKVRIVIGDKHCKRAVDPNVSNSNCKVFTQIKLELWNLGWQWTSKKKLIELDAIVAQQEKLNISLLLYFFIELLVFLCFFLVCICPCSCVCLVGFVANGRDVASCLHNGWSAFTGLQSWH